jgi:hypothetical protein
MNKIINFYYSYPHLKVKLFPLAETGNGVIKKKKEVIDY